MYNASYLVHAVYECTETRDTRWYAPSQHHQSHFLLNGCRTRITLLPQTKNIQTHTRNKTTRRQLKQVRHNSRRNGYAEMTQYHTYFECLPMCCLVSTAFHDTFFSVFVFASWPRCRLIYFIANYCVYRHFIYYFRLFVEGWRRKVLLNFELETVGDHHYIVGGGGGGDDDGENKYNMIDEQIWTRDVLDIGKYV